MTNEELKKKIAQIIADYFCPQRNEHKNLWGDDRLCYSKTNFAECERVTECTDELIAAGIGDVSEFKNHRLIAEYSLIPEDNNAYILPNIPIKVKQLYSGEEVEKIVKERDEYKHRAEVAEKALLLFCDKTMEKYLEIFFKSTNTRVRNKQELYDYYIKQAEKELAEEK